MQERRPRPPSPPPERPPWEDIQRLTGRIDRLIAVIEQWVPAVAAPGMPGVPGPSGPPGAPTEPIEVKITTSVPWKAREPIEIYKENPRSAGTFYAPKLIDFRNGKRLVIKVTSTLDQAIQIQVVSNIRNSIADVVEVGPSLPCASKSNISIGLAYDDWTCFVGVKIVISTPPTEGVLTIEGVVQE